MIFGLTTAEFIVLLPRIISAVELFVQLMTAFKNANGTTHDEAAAEIFGKMQLHLIPTDEEERREFDKAQGQS